MSAAGTRSQAGMHAGVYCSQAALQMAWLSQNNLLGVPPNVNMSVRTFVLPLN